MKLASQFLDHNTKAGDGVRVPRRRDIGIHLVDYPGLAVPHQRKKIEVYVILPDTGVDCDQNISTGLANSQQLPEPFAADMSGGGNPAGNDRAIAVPDQRQRLIDVGGPQIGIEVFFRGLVERALRNSDVVITS